MTILIVDDEPSNVLLLERILQQAGYDDLRSTQDPCEAVALYEQLEPDLLLLDLHMPVIDGFAVLRALSPLRSAGAYLPVIVLTADATQDAKHRALAEGATDFLTKPLDRIEVLLRIENQLRTRQLHCQLAEQNDLLEQRVKQRTRDLEAARLETLQCLARVTELRDDETGRHAERVGMMSSILATALGLDDEQAELVRRAAPLHDCGKIGVPDFILLKPGRLTAEEFAAMELHATLGVEILRGLESPVLRLASEIARTHHERWNGKGYPAALQGNQIPLVGRIVGLVDVFDALTHERPYKPAWTVDAAAAEIEQQAGKHFDPAVVEAVIQQLPSLIATFETVESELGSVRPLSATRRHLRAAS
jgi:putative two-component system response regulator